MVRTAATAKRASSRRRSSAFGLPQQDRADHRRGQRERDAADPGRALERRRGEQRQHDDPQDAALGRAPLIRDGGGHHAGGRHQVLRHPGGLEEPAGEAGGGEQHGVEPVGAPDHAQHRTQRRGERERHHPQRSRTAAGEADRKPHHQGERRKRRHPGQRDVGRPARHAERRGKLGGAEVPEIVVDEPRCAAALAEERIAGRHAEPRHLVDHGDLGMIVDRPGQDDAVGDAFWQQRDRRREREQRGGRPGPGRNARAAARPRRRAAACAPAQSAPRAPAAQAR